MELFKIVFLNFLVHHHHHHHDDQWSMADHTFRKLPASSLRQQLHILRHGCLRWGKWALPLKLHETTDSNDSMSFEPSTYSTIFILNACSQNNTIQASLSKLSRNFDTPKFQHLQCSKSTCHSILLVD